MPNKTWYRRMREAKIALEAAQKAYDRLAEQARDLPLGDHGDTGGTVVVKVGRNRILPVYNKAKLVESYGDKVTTPQFDLAKAKQNIAPAELDGFYEDRDPRVTVEVL